MTDERQIQGNGRDKPGSASPGAVDALLEPETVLGFLMLGLALAVMLAASPGQTREDHLAFLGLAALLIQWVIALSLGCVHLLRRPLRRLSLPAVLLVLTGIVLAVTLASGFTGWVLLASPATTTAGLGEFLVRIAVLAVAMTGAGALVAINAARWRQSRTEIARAELKHLQARIRPHFLFNTLNTVAAFLPNRPRDAESVLLDLSDLLRVALREGQVHRLAEELELTRRYLDIEKRRLHDRILIEWSVPARLPAVDVPSFCIQALAENAVRHGIEPDTVPGLITVTCTDDGDVLQVRVTNTLPRQPATKVPNRGQHIGLSGTRARLAAFLGAEAKLDTGASDGFFVAVLRFPAQATTR